MAKISVIVPVYNTQKYLNKCIDSLLMQTFSDIEIIVVNDGSTDASKQILEDYAKKYPEKIKVIHTKNQGQAAARNLGITLATGEYIGFVDSDDYVALDMYEEMYQLALADDCDMVECNYAHIDEAGKKLPPCGAVRQFKDCKDMFINPFVVAWNKLIRSSVIKGNQIIFPEGYIYEDTAFYIKLVPHIKKFLFLDKVFVFHVERSESTMNVNKSLKVGNIFSVLEDVFRYYVGNNLMQEYRYELEYFCVKILLCSSLERISKIPDKKMRNLMAKKTRVFIDYKFPQYRRNPYMKRGMKQLYMKMINERTIYAWVWLLRVLRSK